MTVMMNNGEPKSYTLANLRKYNKYDFFLVPFFKTVEGQPSNSMVVQTNEDGKRTYLKLNLTLYFRFLVKPTIRLVFVFIAVPSAAPEDVQTGMVNATTAFIRWSAPPPQHVNGALLGYKVRENNSTFFPIVNLVRNYFTSCGSKYQ